MHYRKKHGKKPLYSHFEDCLLERVAKKYKLNTSTPKLNETTIN